MIATNVQMENFQVRVVSHVMQHIMIMTTKTYALVFYYSEFASAKQQKLLKTDSDWKFEQTYDCLDTS